MAVLIGMLRMENSTFYFDQCHKLKALTFFIQIKEAFSSYYIAFFKKTNKTWCESPLSLTPNLKTDSFCAVVCTELG